MKDLEEIKSEDLGCQVQDANPGNFAIEQEVAQLVGATVHAPTAPGDDDARELGAQLLVFLRRALLPIRSALRTAVAAIYAHLDSRCTDYTPAAYAPYQPLPPYDPMRPLIPRTLPNLLTAITAFDSRKISNGSAPNDGIKDGVSLAHLLCSTDAANAVTEIKDDNYGWTMTRNPFSQFANLERLKLGCSEIVRGVTIASMSKLRSLKMNDLVRATANGTSYSNIGFIRDLPECEEIEMDNVSVVTVDGYGSFISDCPKVKKLTLRSFKEWRGVWNGGIVYNMASLEELNLPSFDYCGGGGAGRESFVLDCAVLKKTVVGYGAFDTGTFTSIFARCPNMIHFEFLNQINTSQRFAGWNPTNALDASRTDLIEEGSEAENNLDQFLQNFKNHIALRLTSNGSGLTLTLSQAVRDAIHAAEATYGIEAIIVTQKGWTLSPAPTA